MAAFLVKVAFFCMSELIALPGHDGAFVELDVVTERRRVELRKQQAPILSKIRALIQESGNPEVETARAQDINEEVIILSSEASLLAAQKFVKSIKGLPVKGQEATVELIYSDAPEATWFALRDLVAKHLGFSDKEEKKSLPPSTSNAPAPAEVGNTTATTAS